MLTSQGSLTIAHRHAKGWKEFRESSSGTEQKEILEAIKIQLTIKGGSRTQLVAKAFTMTSRVRLLLDLAAGWQIPAVQSCPLKCASWGMCSPTTCNFLC